MVTFSTFCLSLRGDLVPLNINPRALEKFLRRFEGLTHDENSSSGCSKLRMMTKMIRLYWVQFIGGVQIVESHSPYGHDHRSPEKVKIILWVPWRMLGFCEQGSIFVLVLHLWCESGKASRVWRYGFSAHCSCNN